MDEELIVEPQRGYILLRRQLRWMWIALAAVAMLSVSAIVAIVFMATERSSDTQASEVRFDEVYNLLKYRRYTFKVPSGSEEYNLILETESAGKSIQHDIGILPAEADTTVFVQVDRDQGLIKYRVGANSIGLRQWLQGQITAEVPQTGGYMSRTESEIESGDYLMRYGTSGVGSGPDGKRDWELRLVVEPSDYSTAE